MSVAWARPAGQVLVNSTRRAAGGVGEAEPDRVQPLPGQAQPGGQHGIGPVQPVAGTRVPDRRHMHPDLVRPAGLQDHLDQAGLLKSAVRALAPGRHHLSADCARWPLTSLSR
jgi:hypothetical protein